MRQSYYENSTYTLIVNYSDFHDIAEAREFVLQVLLASANAQAKNAQYTGRLRILIGGLIKQIIVA